MKKITYILFGLCCMALFSCGNNSNKQPAEEVDSLSIKMQSVESLRRNAASSKERLTELPLGFKIGMSEKECKRHLKDLAINKDNYHKLEIDGKTYGGEISVAYHNGMLYAMKISVYTIYVDGGNGDLLLNDAEEEKLHQYLINKYKTYKLITYEIGIEEHYVWNKGNLIIEHEKSPFVIEYYDETVHYPLVNKRYKERIKKEHEQIDEEINEAIEINSLPTNGSVSEGARVTDESDAVICAKDILRQTLVNPKSIKVISSSATLNESRSAYNVTLKYSAESVSGVRVVAVAKVLVRVRDGAGQVLSNTK